MPAKQRTLTTGDVRFDDPAGEREDRRSSPPSYEIATYPADFTLEVLAAKWKSEELFIPPFQRGFVWSQVQASKLIESFLVGLPVPSIFLYTERANERSMVVDGQQRLRSIFYFFEGYFGEPNRQGKRTLFQLKGLSEESPYYNTTWEELENNNPPAALRLKNSVLRAFVIRQLNPNDDTSVFHIFERLNTGGTLLHNQEVRNAVCGGPFNDMLHRLNDDPAWRAILGKATPDTRMRDIELILRFIALYHTVDKYEKPMKDFMSRYMRTHSDAAPDLIAQYEEEFLTTTKIVAENLGAKPFHLFSGFNSSAYDSVFCAVAKHRSSTDTAGLNDRWDSLRRLEGFLSLVRSGTTDVDQVKGRLTLADTHLFP